jgi:GH18 family chitinase
MNFIRSAFCVTALLGFAPARFVFAQDAAGLRLPKRLVADYGYWSRTQTPPYSSAQIPFRKLTHINHAGVNFDANGNLQVPAGFLEPELIARAHAAGAEVLLLLGGDFTGLETNAAALPNLIAKLQAFVAKHGYNGMDIDWEYPASTLDQHTFFVLMKALRAAFPGPLYILSADVPPWGGVMTFRALPGWWITSTS